MYVVHYCCYYIYIFLIPALPPDTPLLDLGALAAFDLSKLPDARKSGEDIIRDIQQEMLTRMGSAEAAVVPEQDAQRLMVGVSDYKFHIYIFLFVSYRLLAYTFH